ncbi:MAG: hypothetical protein H6672_11945 [Anaerolineaceae bacterium]|nr:hypothetical protein [Anaerolineaceae bacterium]
MQEKLFRKAALEKLSSPEELDQLMQITNPRGWLVLVALLLLLGTVVVVGVLGRVSVQVDAIYCVLAKDAQAELEAVIFVAAASEHGIGVGDAAQIVPFSVSRSSGRFILGTVTQIAPRPAYAEEMDSVVDSPDLVDQILQTGPVLRVDVQLNVNEDGSYQWSANSDTAVDVLPGMPCQTVITTGEQAPVNLILRETG